MNCNKYSLPFSKNVLHARIRVTIPIYTIKLLKVLNYINGFKVQDIYLVSTTLFFFSISFFALAYQDHLGNWGDPLLAGFDRRRLLTILLFWLLHRTARANCINTDFKHIYDKMNLNCEKYKLNIPVDWWAGQHMQKGNIFKICCFFCSALTLVGGRLFALGFMALRNGQKDSGIQTLRLGQYGNVLNLWKMFSVLP